MLEDRKGSWRCDVPDCLLPCDFTRNAVNNIANDLDVNHSGTCFQSMYCWTFPSFRRLSACGFFGVSSQVTGFTSVFSTRYFNVYIALSMYFGCLLLPERISASLETLNYCLHVNLFQFCSLGWCLTRKLGIYRLDEEYLYICPHIHVAYTYIHSIYIYKDITSLSIPRL